MADTSVAESRNFTVTDSAARRVAELLKQENAAPGTRLRLAVSGGGCSGFQYGFSFDDQTAGDDRLFRNGEVEVVIDETSLDLLDGSELDWIEDMVGSSFQVKNPNASSGCGCGKSFAV
ncbi:MAG: iron-sulfur cluster insertion protein ErpA [Alphaproteobacteria bacterium]|nr:iron-sulfur cluster insertion protein ErpA [Alphaproteobacteria bacterium]